jgi:hypothetical protein
MRRSIHLLSSQHSDDLWLLRLLGWALVRSLAIVLLLYGVVLLFRCWS